MGDMISLDNIDSASIDAELDVAIALCEYYCKQLAFLNNNGNEQYFQEGEKWDKFKNDLDAPILGKRSESLIKSILMVIPRFINTIIKLIRKTSNNMKVESTIKCIEEIQESVNKIKQMQNISNSRTFKIPKDNGISNDDRDETKSKFFSIINQVESERKHFEMILKSGGKILFDDERQDLQRLEHDIESVFGFIRTSDNNTDDLIALSAMLGYTALHVDFNKWNNIIEYTRNTLELLDEYYRDMDKLDKMDYSRLYGTINRDFLKINDETSKIPSEDVCIYTIADYSKYMNNLKNEFRQIDDSLNNQANQYENDSNTLKDSDPDKSYKIKYLSLMYRTLSVNLSNTLSLFNRDMSNISMKTAQMSHYFRQFIDPNNKLRFK